MDTVVKIEIICAVYLIVLGIALFVRRRELSPLIDEYRRSPALLFTGGLFALLFGLWIVLSHNIWVLSPAVIVTLVGWLSVVKGVALMTWPELWMKLAPSGPAPTMRLARIEAVILEILGVSLLVSRFATGH